MNTALGERLDLLAISSALSGTWNEVILEYPAPLYLHMMIRTCNKTRTSGSQPVNAVKSSSLTAGPGAVISPHGVPSLEMSLIKAATFIKLRDIAYATTCWRKSSVSLLLNSANVMRSHLVFTHVLDRYKFSITHRPWTQKLTIIGVVILRWPGNSLSSTSLETNPRYAIVPDHTGSIERDIGIFCWRKLLRRHDLIPSMPIKISHLAVVPSPKWIITSLSSSS